MANLKTRATKSQKAKICEYLQNGYRISHNRAKILFRSARLAARICELRKAGFEIDDVYVHYIDQDGNTISYKQYFLKKTAA